MKMIALISDVNITNFSIVTSLMWLAENSELLDNVTGPFEKKKTNWYIA